MKFNEVLLTASEIEVVPNEFGIALVSAIFEFFKFDF